MQKTIGNQQLTLEIGDISEKKTDAIVNAVNGTLLGGGTLDETIRKKAGAGLHEECADIYKNRFNNEQLSKGQAVITGGYDLPAKYVIHAVGPIWDGNKEIKQAKLTKTYQSCLSLAKEHNIRSIAFPSLSTGIYQFPINLAAEVAVKTIVDFLKEEDFGDVIFTLFSERSYEVYANELRKLMG